MVSMQDNPAAPKRLIAETAAPAKKIGEREIAEPRLTGLFSATLAVLALLVASFLVMRRLMKNSKLLAGAGTIRVLARRPLASKQELVLVDMGPRILLLGTTRDAVNALAEFTRPEELAALRGKTAGSEIEFKAALDESLKKGAAPEPYEKLATELSEIKKTVQAWKD